MPYVNTRATQNTDADNYETINRPSSCYRTAQLGDTLYFPGHGYWKMNISPLGDKNVMDRSKHRWAESRRQRHRYTVDIQRWEIYIKHQIQKFFMYESGEKSARTGSSGDFYFACVYDVLGKQMDPHTTTMHL
jgi:hypothetical protein